MHDILTSLYYRFDEGGFPGSYSYVRCNSASTPDLSFPEARRFSLTASASYEHFEAAHSLSPIRERSPTRHPDARHD